MTTDYDDNATQHSECLYAEVSKTNALIHTSTIVHRRASCMEIRDSLTYPPPPTSPPAFAICHVGRAIFYIIKIAFWHRLLSELDLG